MKKLFVLVSVMVAAVLVLAACGPGATAAPTDLLAQVKQRGYIVVSTDPNYQPQSFLNTAGKRPADTKCPSDTLTTPELQGFDIDVAHKIGDGLGVETCFATPDWDIITAGSWANKWDMSVGSMTIKPARQEVLYFTKPYYYTPAIVAVPADSTLTSLDDLANQAVCVGTATTYEDWLNGKSDLPASTIYVQPPADVTVVPLTTDQDCPQALAAGRKDFVAYVTSATVVDSNIAAGLPVKKLGGGGAVFSENLAVALDKASSLDPQTLLAAVDTIVKTMHSDGTLAALSIQWFGADLTGAPFQ